MEAFSTLDVNQIILSLDELKCKLKSVYAADFAKQPSSIEEVVAVIWGLELNQGLG